MDFPRDNHLKKKGAPTSQPIHQKQWGQQSNPGSFGPNKGKIAIQQYEYDEENILGHGFSSRVYLGRLAANHRKQFAIKVVDKKKISRIKQNLQLLKEEIVIHKQLDHPNIVKCYEIIDKPTHYYFVLQYCPHGTLDSFIKKHEKLNESVAIGIMEQVISAYKYLLNLKVLHRDLKPPNILKSGPNWKICDFGFSLIGKKNYVGELNVGTPAYMAPEALERSFYSSKTDFFSLGVICFQMLFGVTPWKHKNEKILLRMMKESKIGEDVFSSLRNQQLIDFILKSVEIFERKRMKIEQFQAFDFWKDTELVPLRRREARTRPLSKALFVKDYPSTNPSQVSVNTSAIRSGTRSEKSISTDDLFKGNSAVMQRELYYATLIRNLAKNHAYLLFQEPAEKELFLTVLTKHQSYISRRTKHEKTNYLMLKKWKEYIETKEYSAYKLQNMSLQSSLKQLLEAQLKKKTITTIRYVNKRFDDLTYEHILSFACMNNLKEYLMELIVKTLRRYEAVGKEYISSNRWTVQVIASLLQYYSYVGDALKTSEESRIIALKEDDKDRTPLIQNFAQSSLGEADFDNLKEQIRCLQLA